MAITAGEIIRSVHAAYRLARFDPGGMAELDRSRAGALRSFWGPVLILPFYAILMALRLPESADDLPLWQIVTVEGIGYTISVVLYPLLMHHVCGSLKRDALYPGFVSAYNWSAVIQIAVYLPVSLVSLAGDLPDGVAGALVFGVTMAMLTYQWFVARTALQVGGFAAAAMVLLDLFLAALVGDMTDSLLN
ncbi:hypothetical protein M2352_002952 [Azospirillum fermentarium]|uniref:hypothetical protein n=1 Tax=Azospirillum fermentarium TaxID=1233114 RepID=UPI0022260C1B|nr:hypothetical protein [Azospirillum fermentarium]MCW2247361.1 hypothetical protein [Azospirillum fermentarium]